MSWGLYFLWGEIYWFCFTLEFILEVKVDYIICYQIMFRLCFRLCLKQFYVSWYVWLSMEPSNFSLYELYWLSLWVWFNQIHFDAPAVLGLWEPFIIRQMRDNTRGDGRISTFFLRIWDGDFDRVLSCLCWQTTVSCAQK